MGALTYDIDWHGSWEALSSASSFGSVKKSWMGLSGMIRLS